MRIFGVPHMCRASYPRELPLDGSHLGLAVADLLLTLEVIEAPLPVQVTKVMPFLSIIPALARVPQA